MQTPQWKRFFQDEAERYLDNVFTKNTAFEVDFIEEELGLKPGDRNAESRRRNARGSREVGDESAIRILDIGCGTGRHSLELARRGYRCTGIDQSPDMLAIARQAARNEKLEISFVEGDAASTRLEETFDHAICLCEGAVSLLEVDVEPVAYHRAIFSNIAAMLGRGAVFLLTALNGYRLAREHSDADIASGHFDPITTSHTETMELRDGGNAQVVEKGFFPGELRLLLEEAGFRVEAIYGGTAGDWGRRPVKLDEIELMVVGRAGE